MEIVKVTTKRYKVVSAAEKPFMGFKFYREGREKWGQSVQRTCFNCNRKFKDEDDIYLVILKGTYNHLLCKECNDIALADLKKEGVI